MLATLPHEPSSTTDRIAADSLLAPYVSMDDDVMHGEPCFAGTRVPVRALFDHLRAGDRIDDFLEGYPDVSRDQAVGVIDLASLGLLQGLKLA